MMMKSFVSKSFFSQVKTLIESTLKEKLVPRQFYIIDESAGHSRGKETHFNVYIVSEMFKNLNKVQRHKLVYESLGDVMGKFHALTLTCRTG
jgi:BolA protein